MMMERIIVLILLSLTLCMAMSFMGGAITTFIQFLWISRGEAGLNPASVVLASLLYEQGLPVLQVEILTRIPINIADRLISAFMGYGIALACMPLARKLGSRLLA